MRQRINVKIRGRVQGVFFRETVRRIAQDFAVGGFARKAGSDTVEIEAEGEEDAVNAFIDEVLQHPPPMAHIDDVKRCRIEPAGDRDFHVRESLR